MYRVESIGLKRARIPLRQQSVVEFFGTARDHEHVTPTQGLPVSRLTRCLRLGRS
jgi:hypothetical protein